VKNIPYRISGITKPLMPTTAAQCLLEAALCNSWPCSHHSISMDNYEEESMYMRGFGNEFESEAEGYEGLMPRNSINPQRVARGLFTEQLSGSAFTAPRGSNRRRYVNSEKLNQWKPPIPNLTILASICKLALSNTSVCLPFNFQENRRWQICFQGWRVRSKSTTMETVRK